MAETAMLRIKRNHLGERLALDLAGVAGLAELNHTLFADGLHG
jgi:hypothetical protein